MIFLIVLRLQSVHLDLGIHDRLRREKSEMPNTMMGNPRMGNLSLPEQPSLGNVMLKIIFCGNCNV